MDSVQHHRAHGDHPVAAGAVGFEIHRPRHTLHLIHRDRDHFGLLTATSGEQAKAQHQSGGADFRGLNAHGRPFWVRGQVARNFPANAGRGKTRAPAQAVSLRAGRAGALGLTIDLV